MKKQENRMEMDVKAGYGCLLTEETDKSVHETETLRSM